AEPRQKTPAGQMPPQGTVPRMTQVPAQQPPPGAGEQEPLELQPVVVTAPRVATPLTRVPAAISVVEQEDIQQGQQTIGLDESLVRVPGVFPQNRFNFAQDLRLSIRGFGARSAFGIRGIKILVDGSPATLPEGQSQVDSLDLGSAKRIEVMRGPVSALYGNASGGVISIITEDGPPRPFVEARTSFGEFGLWKTQLKSGGQAGPLNYLVNVSRLELGGFRDQSRTESVVFNSKLRLDIDDSSDLIALINVVDSPRADDPGGLTREQVEADRRQAAPLNLRFRTGEEVTQGRFGLVYRRQLGLYDLEVTGYYTAREFRNSIPFRVVEFDRGVIGGGIKYGYGGRLLSHGSRLTVGIDVGHQDDRRRNFNNVGGEPGETLSLFQDERVTSIGPYVQEEFDLVDNLTLLLGGRYDNVRFAVDDFLTSDGDDSGSRTFAELSGRFGLVYTPFPELNPYVNIAESFETPTTTELVNRPGGGGGINPEIEPQKSINYEIGVKGQAFQRLAYELALFFIFLQDELIRFEDDTGRAFFRNVGKSRRDGVELGLSLQVIEGLRASLAYTYLDATFREFVKDGVDLEGNAVPGLPPHQVHGELFYRHPLGFYGGIDVLYVNEFFVDDENTEKNDAYTVANLRLGYEHRFGGWTVSPFFGIQNLFDEQYNSNVRINAFGDRFFEPAPDLNVYGGLTVAHHW
ncbi:MAG: TonB-dependent receptor family protein, partial [Anaerolineae bacterium]